jgi:hypothetical protein
MITWFSEGELDWFSVGYNSGCYMIGTGLLAYHYSHCVLQAKHSIVYSRSPIGSILTLLQRIEKGILRVLTSFEGSPAPQQEILFLHLFLLLLNI